MGFGSTPTYHPVNRLQVPEAAMRVNRKTHFKNIMSQGQWTVKKLDFNLSDRVTLRTRVTGAGMGYLYASFVKEGKPHILTIKKVTPGFHDLDFTVPYPVLEGFRIGISTTVPKGYSIDGLSKKDKYKLQTNSMMLSQSTPMFESPGIGFGGLGALQDIDQIPKGGRDSAYQPYWDGNWDNFSWNNGVSGDKETYCNVNNEKSPKVGGSYHGYYANRMSISIARFDKEDKFLGWDMVDGNMENQILPTGVPLMMVMQFFVLQKKTKSGDGQRAHKDPYWEYADQYNPQATKCCFVSDSFYQMEKRTMFSDTSYRPNDSGRGVIKNVQRRWVVSTKHGGGIKIGDNYFDVKDLACKVEWYDEVSGTWSQPRTNPMSVPETTEKGFTRLIFRIPRQLSTTTDKDILKQLAGKGVDYSYETTKKYFPHPKYPIGQNGKKDYTTAAGVGYAIPSRPVEEKSMLEFEEDGDIYYGLRKLRLNFYFGYGKHRYAGVAGDDGGGPKSGHAMSRISLRVADPDKMARVNNPELLNAFYPAGGFKTGGVVIAIARGMSLTSKYAIRLDNNAKGPDGLYENQLDNTGDGSNIGTKEAALIKPTGIILSTDLGDDRQAPAEEVVLAAWKAKFGEPLTKAFFDQYSFKDAIPEKPTHYKVKDPVSGIFVEAPYQIVYYKIGPEYNGPYADYAIETTKETNSEGQEEEVTKLVLTKPEDKPYAISKGQSLYLHSRSIYGNYDYQKIDIVTEVEEQRTLLQAGLTPEETVVYNNLNDPPQDSTDANAVINQADQYMRDMAVAEGIDGDSPTDSADPDAPRLPSGAKYVRSGDKWRMNPKYYARESQLKDAGFLGGIKNALSGFTDSRDFYVEDVTDKWGASTRAGLGGLGFVDIPLVDSAEEDLEDVMRDTGYLMQAITNSVGAGAGAVYNIFNGDIDKAGDKFDYIVDELTDAKPVDNFDDMSVLTLSANIARNAGQYAVKKPIAAGVDLVGDITGLGGYSANGLGDFWDKAADVGEGVGKFARGTVRGLTPDSITEAADDGLAAVSEKFKQRPMLYTGIALAAVPLLIPGIGGAYARNMKELAGGAVSLVPKAFRAGVDTISTVSSGAIAGVKSIGSSITGTPSKRGTAARRRRYNRR